MRQRSVTALLRTAVTPSCLLSSAPVPTWLQRPACSASTLSFGFPTALLAGAICAEGWSTWAPLPWACLRDLTLLRTFRRGENNYLVLFLERTFEIVCFIYSHC